ncbi:MAG: rhomboid family intramembrane serine protease [Chromatiales bacterium]|nr:rhomboid family intramembrane serine protease [Chromatiales bacterium]
MNFKREHIGFGSQVRVVIAICLLIAAIEMINILTGRYLNQFGLIPRKTDAIHGIILAPLLHGSLMHFFSNIVPLAIFSLLMLQHGTKRFALVTTGCILISGALVWFFGRATIHVGSSSLIYGYFGYLLLAGILSGKIKLILISLFVGFVYGGLIFGVLPSSPYISWESHLFGFVSGLGCAIFWARDKSTDSPN